MCGFAGFWDPEGAETGLLESTVGSMADTLSHRGPDDRGTWCDGPAGIALGHRRLSVLDLSDAGHQPMRTPDGRFVLAYNGEVYNFRELESELESEGVHVRSRGDTEVVLQSLATWGPARALERFVGMFALALWDTREQRLFLARDRLGIKPLYFGTQGDVLFFASELKALRAHPRFQSDLDRGALALYFRHDYVPAPHTIHPGIRKLEPGCWARVDRPSSVRVERYWSLRDVVRRGLEEPLALTEHEASLELEARLGEAVRQRLVADVPLGAFLSGGIDSSTIAALMQVHSGRRVQTYTIGFHEEGFDEARHAREVAAHLGTDHHELYLTPEEALAVIPTIAERWDEPFSDSSQIPTYLVSRFAREQVTVCLSGDGGDELFGGYRRYWLASRLRRYLDPLPGPGRRMLAALLSGASSVLERSRVPAGRTVRRMRRSAELLAAADDSTLYRSLISHWVASDGLVIGADEPPTILTDASIGRELGHPLDLMMFLDSVTYLPDDILCKVDRASMAVSLEARVPLLDHRVVELVWRLPREIRVGEEPGKRLLRSVLSRHVPERLYERPKMGFGVPISSWLRGPLRSWCEELLDARRLREQGVLAVEPVRKRWEEHTSGRMDWGYHLWDVLVFQAWYQRWQA